MTHYYSRFFANPLRNGYVDVKSAVVGELAWSRKIGDFESDSAHLRLLLSGEDYIIADNIREQVCVKRSGEIAWRRPCWYSCQIALEDDLLFFTDPERNDFIQAVDRNNEIRYSDSRVWGMIKNAYLTLFEPGTSESFYQIQFIHDPHNARPLMMCYRDDRENPGIRWAVDLECEGSPIIPFLHREQKKLLTTTRTEVVILDTESMVAEPAPVTRFSFPLHDATHWVSAAPDGKLYWCGTGEEGAAIGVSDFDGKLEWRHPHGLAGRAVAPPLIGKELVWLVTSDGVYAFKQHKLVWKYESIHTSLTFATAVADDTIYLCGIDRLIKLDGDGLVEFDLKFQEPLSSPPVVDAAGQLYVAGKGMVYAFV